MNDLSEINAINNGARLNRRIALNHATNGGNYDTAIAGAVTSDARTQRAKEGRASADSVRTGRSRNGIKGI